MEKNSYHLSVFSISFELFSVKILSGAEGYPKTMNTIVVLRAMASWATCCWVIVQALKMIKKVSSVAAFEYD